jgi:hypothetical protein
MLASQLFDEESLSFEATPIWLCQSLVGDSAEPTLCQQFQGVDDAIQGIWTTEVA